jgi:hypothetical protein
MTLNRTFGLLVAAVLLASGCLDRKHVQSDASSVVEAGVHSDSNMLPPFDTSPSDHNDAGNPGSLDGSSPPIDGPTNSGPEAGSDLSTLTDSGADSLRADQSLPGTEVGADSQVDTVIQPTPDLAPDNPILSGPDGGRDLGSDAPIASDLATDVPIAPDLVPDLAPTGCVIGGTPYANGDHNPSNSCQICKQASLPSSWSNADEGTQCGSSTGMFCNSGTCKSGCFISSVYYPASGPNPNNPCQICQPALPNSWSQASNGATCSTSPGQICNAGSCQTGCWIGGSFIGSSATNLSNTCQICTPTKSTSAWSNNDAATAVSCGSCGGTAACIGGALGTCSKNVGTYYQDADGDGYGNPGVTPVVACTAPTGWVAQAGDCDDTNARIHPGYTTCESFDINTLGTCASDGTIVFSTCANGCAGGQCRSFATVSVAGTVTCGTLQCPATQGCSFAYSYAGDIPPTCGTSASNSSATCDGPNDCTGGQLCCYTVTTGSTTVNAKCVPNDGSCPYANMGGSGKVVCDPIQAGCPGGTTCQMLSSVLSVYVCQ